MKLYYKNYSRIIFLAKLTNILQTSFLIIFTFSSNANEKLETKKKPDISKKPERHFLLEKNTEIKYYNLKIDELSKKLNESEQNKTIQLNLLNDKKDISNIQNNNFKESSANKEQTAFIEKLLQEDFNRIREIDTSLRSKNKKIAQPHY